MNETFVINNDAKFDALLDLARGLIARGTPIDGVGLQAQLFVNRPPSRENLREKLEAIASLGLVAEITEVGISIGLYDEEADPIAAQAAGFADVFGACLDVPACTGVTTWDVYDAETWLDEFFPISVPHRPLGVAAPGPSRGQFIETLQGTGKAVAPSPEDP